MENKRLYIACAAWLVAMVVLPADVEMLFLAGLYITE
jgi:hypothetical protein